MNDYITAERPGRDSPQCDETAEREPFGAIDDRHAADADHIVDAEAVYDVPRPDERCQRRDLLLIRSAQIASIDHAELQCALGQPDALLVLGQVA
jgi:hypothetical protein